MCNGTKLTLLHRRKIEFSLADSTQVVASEVPAGGFKEVAIVYYPPIMVSVSESSCIANVVR